MNFRPRILQVIVSMSFLSFSDFVSLLFSLPRPARDEVKFADAPQYISILLTHLGGISMQTDRENLLYYTAVEDIRKPS